MTVVAQVSARAPADRDAEGFAELCPPFVTIKPKPKNFGAERGFFGVWGA